MLEVKFPDKLAFLISEPATIKVLWGGRGAAKTESVSIALLLWSIQRKLRIACFRELQKSIDESVYSTLKSQIYDMSLEDEFQILNKTIISKRTGSEFIFEGLRYNINSIKSMSRIDIAWVEEANNVSRSSWDKLIPTLRGRPHDDINGRGGPFGLGPELIITFNPEMDTDETYKRFVLQREKYAPDYIVNERTGQKERYCICVKVNWQDNPFFPDDLRIKMSIDRDNNPDKYLEVWEGNTKQIIDGSIYADEIRQVLKDGKRGKVPYDPSKPVYTFWDLGHSDKTAIWFIQRVGLEYNIINFYQNNLKKLGHYLQHMQSLNYVYGTVYMPHDADNETLASRSIASMTREAGYKVIVVQRPAKKLLGINAARTVFPLCNFDEDNTSDGWQCLTRYAFKVDDQTQQFSKEPDHDTPWSHAADGWQTFALSLKTEQDAKKPKQKSDILKLLPPRPNAWMGSL